MKFGSVCSGIEAASVAWYPLGWQASFLSEIDAFPRAVLSHHYPDVPLHGDFTTIQKGDYAAIDLLVGGTPCQSFSVAGLRAGLRDPRGNLMLEFGALARRLEPRWIVWENVPGVLSSAGGRDFGTFLGMLGELGYGFSYRILDAQYFGVAQRRRRVFVVGCFGNWRAAAAVLFERHSVQGHPAPRRKAGKDTAGSTGDGIARCLTTGEMKRQDWETCNFVSHALRGEGFDASEDGTGRGTPLVPVRPYTLAIRGRGDSHNLEYRQDGTANALLTPNGGRGGIGVGAIAFNARQDPDHWQDRTGPLDTDGGTQAVAFAQNQRDEVRTVEVAGALAAEPGAKQQTYLHQSMQVRRLTPRECERLQGFPDDYTRIPWKLGYWPADKHPPKIRAAVAELCPDGPRYKALGNSMAVPVMAWIGRRIQQVEAITNREAA